MKYLRLFAGVVRLLLASPCYLIAAIFGGLSVLCNWLGNIIIDGPRDY